MSLQWKLVAGFLYSEGAFVCLLLLPFISPHLWRKIFKSRLASKLGQHGTYVFYFIFFGLIVLLLDSIRTMYKKQSIAKNGLPTMESVAEFRAQRNFYITATALFLLFVIKRLMALILRSADILNEMKATQNELASAKKEVTRLSEWKEQQKAFQEADNEGSSDENKKDN